MDKVRKQLFGFCLLLIVWQGVAISGLAPSDYFPGIPRVAVALGHMVETRAFWLSVAATCQRFASGLSIAILVGLALAMATARSPLLRRALDPLVEILRVLPPPALVPFAIYALGLGPRMFLFIIVNAAVWPVYVNASSALADSDQNLRLTGKAFGYGPLEIMWKVQLPAATPEIFTGIRIAAGFALLATVAAEMLAGTNGLGRQLYDAGFSLDTPRMFALMFVIGVLGIAIQAATSYVRHALAGWRTKLARIAQPA